MTVYSGGTSSDAASVLVIGAMAVDAKGKPRRALVPGTSAPGTVRLSVGGVARNIAENLARLGVHATLLSVVGDDPIGRFLLDATARSGVDVEHVLLRRGQRSGAYLAVLDRNGAPAHAIDDMAVLRYLVPGRIYRLRRLFRDASMIVLDANEPPRTIETIPLAERVRPYLGQTYLIVPNLQEARALVCTPDEELDAQDMAMRLVSMDVEIAIITLGEKGLYYATSDERGHVPALQRDVVDLTGAGDALTAAVIFAILNDIPISEAVRLGISAAALTIQCPDTVCPDLSLDRLYGELVI
jgi:pseudouridine kinase